ncbi:MAG: NUDIX domain-containing protein [Parcubacteria group bacterium]|nr:NUDIX domain-containing protein [Parcubacteria group bacterium]
MKSKKFLAGKVEPEGRDWFVQIIKSDSLPIGANVTAVAVVACLRNKILFIRNNRGWDIPGGHIETSDESIEKAAKRELLEEACARCGPSQLVGCLVSDFYPDGKTYIAILRTEVTSLLDFSPQHETIERKLISPEECIKLYYGNTTLMKKLLKVALEK